MSNARILMLIAGFIALTLGSFIWFIATWDAEKEQPIGLLDPEPPATISHKILSPLATPTSERATT